MHSNITQPNSSNINPKFEFDAVGKEGRLGLDNVGRPPQLTAGAWEAAEAVELKGGVERRGWAVLGPSVKGRGVYQGGGTTSPAPTC